MARFLLSLLPGGRTRSPSALDRIAGLGGCAPRWLAPTGGSAARGGREEAAALAGFLRGLGLPLTLADLLERDLPPSSRVALARVLLRPKSGIHHLPRPVTEADILRAMEEAEALGGNPAAARPEAAAPPGRAGSPRRRRPPAAGG